MPTAALSLPARPRRAAARPPALHWRGLLGLEAHAGALVRAVRGAASAKVAAAAGLSECDANGEAARGCALPPPAQLHWVSAASTYGERRWELTTPWPRRPRSWRTGCPPPLTSAAVPLLFSHSEEPAPAPSKSQAWLLWVGDSVLARGRPAVAAPASAGAAGSSSSLRISPDGAFNGHEPAVSLLRLVLSPESSMLLIVMNDKSLSNDALPTGDARSVLKDGRPELQVPVEFHANCAIAPSIRNLGAKNATKVRQTPSRAFWPFDAAWASKRHAMEEMDARDGAYPDYASRRSHGRLRRTNIYSILFGPFRPACALDGPARARYGRQELRGVVWASHNPLATPWRVHLAPGKKTKRLAAPRCQKRVKSLSIRKFHPADSFGPFLLRQ